MCGGPAGTATYQHPPPLGVREGQRERGKNCFSDFLFAAIVFYFSTFLPMAAIPFVERFI